MANIYCVCDPTISNKEVVCDHPTGVVSGEDEIMVTVVEITPNPTYVTVTSSKHNVLSKQSLI